MSGRARLWTQTSWFQSLHSSRLYQTCFPLCSAAFYSHCFATVTSLHVCKWLLCFRFLLTGLSAHLFIESLKVGNLSNSSFQDLARCLVYSRCSVKARIGKCWNNTGRMGDRAANWGLIKTHWNKMSPNMYFNKGSFNFIFSIQPVLGVCAGRMWMDGHFLGLFSTRGKRWNSELGWLYQTSNKIISFI